MSEMLQLSFELCHHQDERPAADSRASVIPVRVLRSFVPQCQEVRPGRGSDEKEAFLSVLPSASCGESFASKDDARRSGIRTALIYSDAERGNRTSGSLAAVVTQNRWLSHTIGMTQTFSFEWQISQ